MLLEKRHLQLQKGASLTEMIVVSPALLLLGLAIIQAGLIYHGKTTVNYATFEAARTGAVNHGQVSVMRKELGIRLAPLEGGDGSTDRAAIAVTQSVLKASNPVTTRLKIVSPSIEAFEDWKIIDEEGREVIPNNHLRHVRGELASAGDLSGLTLRDANLLKIQVTHGLELKVPIVNRLLSEALLVIDPINALFYTQNLMPIKSVSTVRMQSELWKGEVLASHEPPPESTITVASLTNPTESISSTAVNQSSICSSNHGLGDGPSIIDTESYESGVCTVSDLSFTASDGAGSEVGEEC